jgi:hypothetical protein
MNLFKSKEKKFWDWFQKNEEFILSWKTNQESVFNILNQKLQEVSKGLTFEFGPIVGGKQELVISADGISSLIPSVKSLANEAPRLEKWIITAFRQPIGLAHSLVINNIIVSADDINFSFEGEKDGKIDLIFFVRSDAKNQDIYVGAIFMMLDSIIGEYNVMTKIGNIDFNFDQKSGYPLYDLEKYWKTKYS